MRGQYSDGLRRWSALRRNCSAVGDGGRDGGAFKWDAAIATAAKGCFSSFDCSAIVVALLR